MVSPSSDACCVLFSIAYSFHQWLLSITSFLLSLESPSAFTLKTTTPGFSSKTLVLTEFSCLLRPELRWGFPPAKHFRLSEKAISEELAGLSNQRKWEIIISCQCKPLHVKLMQMNGLDGDFLFAERAETKWLLCDSSQKWLTRRKDTGLTQISLQFRGQSGCFRGLLLQFIEFDNGTPKQRRKVLFLRSINVFTL